jgi:hypothetical protein
LAARWAARLFPNLSGLGLAVVSPRFGSPAASVGDLVVETRQELQEDYCFYFDLDLDYFDWACTKAMVGLIFSSFPDNKTKRKNCYSHDR